MLRLRSRWRFASARAVPGRRMLATIALAVCFAFVIGLTLPVPVPTASAQSPETGSDDSDANPVFASEEADPIPAFPDDSSRVDGLRHETTVYGADTFTPDSPASIRVLVNAARGVFQTIPLAGANAVFTLHAVDADGVVSEEAHALREATTNEFGSVDGNFHVPDVADGRYVLRVATESAYGSETVDLPIKLKREFRILLVSDKPMYQPNQLIHMRATTLVAGTLKPVSERELTFEVEDSKGNKVFKRRATTNEFGIAAADFQLADEINMGAYKLRAILGQHETEKSVTVDRYVLPKFGVKINTDKQFYLPKQTIKGTIDAQFTFGKPVNDAEVLITASTFDVEFTQFAQLTTRTGDDGTVEFELPLPDYFVGQPLERGDALVKVDVTVRDATDHVQKKTITFPVANSSIRLTALAESGRLVPDVENTVYVVATTPDGRPVEAECVGKFTVQVDPAENDGKAVVTREVTFKTNKWGLGELKYTPARSEFQPGEWVEQRTKVIGIENPNWDWAYGYQAWQIPVSITATDATGQQGTFTANLTTDPMQDNLLVRTDKAIYTAGDRMKIDLLTTFKKGVCYLDITRGDQTLLTKTILLDDGSAQYELDLGPDMFGTLELHVYKRLKDGVVIRDTKVLYAHPKSDLDVQIATFKEVLDPDTGEKTLVEVRESTDDCLRPGEDAILKFCVVDRDGNPTQAALGVTIVDEAVYLLQDMQPGIEKIYFTLERELMEPRYHMKELPQISTFVETEVAALVDELQTAGQILMSRVEPMANYTIAIDPAATRAHAFQEFGDVLSWVWTQNAVANPGEYVEYTEDGTPTFKAGSMAHLMKTVRDDWGYTDLVDRITAGGVELTLDHLTSYWPVYSAKWLHRMHLAQGALQAMRAVQTAMLANVTLVEMRDGKRQFVADLWTRLAKTSDGSLPPKRIDGRVLTHDELCELVPEFTPDGLVAALDDEYTTSILNALYQVHAKTGALAKQEAAALWNYRDDLVEFCKEHGFDMTRYLDGSSWRDYVAAHPLFSWDNVSQYLLSRVMSQSLALIDSIGYWYELQQNEDGTSDSTLPENVWTVIRDNWGMPAKFNVDPWGQTLALDRTDERRVTQSPAARYHLVSMGPDAKLGTDDDRRDAVESPAMVSAFLESAHGLSAIVTALSIAVEYGRYYWPQLLLEDNWAEAIRDEQLRNWGWGWGLWGDERELQDGLGFPGESRGFRGGMPRPGADPSDSLRRDRENGATGMVFEDDDGAEMPSNSNNSHGEAGSAQRKASIRVREYFPETLLWAPNIITDDKGMFELRQAMADSITTWRLTASANNRAGQLGGATHGIRVFQDFFVDIDLPVALTQNDEVSIPISVFNYLDSEQQVALEFEKGDWFEIMEPSNTKTLTLAAFERTAVYFRIKVKKLGMKTLTCWAFGSKQDDAVRRTIRVLPDGKEFEAVFNGKLTKTIEHSVAIPSDSVPEASKILVKVYPGVFAQMIEGIAGMVGMPHG